MYVHVEPLLTEVHVEPYVSEVAVEPLITEVHVEPVKKPTPRGGLHSAPKTSAPKPKGPPSATEIGRAAKIPEVIDLVIVLDSEGNFLSYNLASEDYDKLTGAKAYRIARGSYIIPPTDTNIAVLMALGAQFQGEAQALAASIRLNEVQAVQSAMITARWHTNEEVPEHNLILHPDHPLDPHQIVCLAAQMPNGVGRDGYAEFMEMGTGKTAVAIARICNEIAQRRANGSNVRYHNKMYTTIVVVPKAVRRNWVSELRKFATEPLHIVTVRGNKLNRLDRLIEFIRMAPPEATGRVLVVSYGHLRHTWGDLGMIHFDLAILDESHLIKNDKTKRAEYCHNLRDRANARLILTGSPIGNSLLDLFSQLEFLGKGCSGFLTKDAFRKAYWDCNTVATQDGHKSGVEKLEIKSGIPMLKARLSKIGFIARKDKVLKYLPKKQYRTIETTMTKEQVDLYVDLADKLQGELPGEGAGNVAINNHLTKMLKLAQITAGFLKVPPVKCEETGEVLEEGYLYRFEKNPKLEALIDLCKDECYPPHGSILDKKIIWTSTVDPVIPDLLTRFSDEFGEESIVSYYGDSDDAHREESVRRFNNDPTCKFFIGSQGSGGVGLNLFGYDVNNPDTSLTNCTDSVYYIENWSYLERNQSEGRAHRRGTRVPQMITDMLVPDSIEEVIREAVTGKEEHAFTTTDLSDMLRELVKAVDRGLGV